MWHLKEAKPQSNHKETTSLIAKFTPMRRYGVVAPLSHREHITVELPLLLATPSLSHPSPSGQCRWKRASQVYDKLG